MATKRSSTAEVIPQLKDYLGDEKSFTIRVNYWCSFNLISEALGVKKYYMENPKALRVSDKIWGYRLIYLILSKHMRKKLIFLEFRWFYDVPNLHSLSLSYSYISFLLNLEAHFSAPKIIIFFTIVSWVICQLILLLHLTSS